MNKKIKVTAATTAVAAILLTTNNVKAEEGTIETPNTDVTTTAIAKEVTKEDVINAEQTYNKVTAELKTAEDNAEKAKEIVRDLQNKEIELSTEIKEAETITPDKLKEAEHSIAKLGTKQEETEAALMLVNAQVEEVKQEKDARILAVANAEKNANKAIENLENAQREKQTIEDASNPQVIENAKQEVEVANQTVETARTSVENATAKLEEAKVFDKQLEVNIQNAKTTMDEALANKREKELHADELKAVSDKAQADLQKAQFENDDRYAGFPTDIKLDEGFVKAFKAWMDFRNDDATNDLFVNNREEYNRQNNALHQKVLDAEMRIINSPNNKHYIVGRSSEQSFANEQLNQILAKVMEITNNPMRENDGHHELYDTQNLSNDMIEELNLYGVEVLNSIRSQFGLEALKVNKNALAMAGDIANEVENARFTTEDHYVSGIVKIARKYGLNDTGNYYENLMITYNTRMATKEELYARVLMAMVGFFYEAHTEGQNVYYGHAR